MIARPHPFRLELVERWSAFLEGGATHGETAAYVDLRLVDYGAEELVHNGLLLLNDDLLAQRAGGAAFRVSRERFEAWGEVAASFDADPDLWNREWALGYLYRVLPGIRGSRRRLVIGAVADKLHEGDVAKLLERFDRDS